MNAVEWNFTDRTEISGGVQVDDYLCGSPTWQKIGQNPQQYQVAIALGPAFPTVDGRVTEPLAPGPPEQIHLVTVAALE
ncbi:hypothetical protein ACIBSV_30280 [Embleya sp. NPDC050154]|uniref:hypothetical protein n=1 Tax=Embleya sp. NPDC050154 TaxID=3363988 RepID=UPI0037B9F706